jgi:drug/metabolite transporter (DMT)-like permease
MAPEIVKGEAYECEVDIWSTGVIAASSTMSNVPPTTALMAWTIFGEVLAAPKLLGMVLTAVGVALVVTALPARLSR